MPLREELILKKPSDNRVRVIYDMSQDIVDGIYAGNDVDKKIESLGKFTGRECYDFEYFRTLKNHSSVEEFAQHAALPIARKIPGITREDLIEIVKLILVGDYPDSDYYLELLESNVPMSNVSDLIFWPETDDLTPEEIVDTALSSPDSVIRL